MKKMRKMHELEGLRPEVGSKLNAKGFLEEIYRII
jgi:hypothetical protein